MASSNLSLKLLIDKKNQRVVFAEAGKEFVDFLFSLLTLPIGTVLSLVGNEHMAGSLPMLYQSFSDLDDEYVKSDQKKEGLLNPTPSFPFIVPHQVPLLPIKEWLSSKPMDITTGTATLYKCGHCSISMFTATYGSRCLSCSRDMTTVVTDYVSNDTPGGFVKGLVTYMVADDLSVFPMSTLLNVSLLNKFNIKDLGELEDKVVVQIGMDEGVELLRHSLNSKTVLTNVFSKVVKESSASKSNSDRSSDSSSSSDSDSKSSSDSSSDSDSDSSDSDSSDSDSSSDSKNNIARKKTFNDAANRRKRRRL